MAGKIADTLNEIFQAERAYGQRVRAHQQRRGQGREINQRQPRPGLRRLGGLRGFGEWTDRRPGAAIHEVARVIGSVAKGDLSQTMALEVDGRSLKGEFLHTARVVNTMVAQLNSFASEVTRVAREVGTEGKLAARRK